MIISMPLPTMHRRLFYALRPIPAIRTIAVLILPLLLLALHPTTTTGAVTVSTRAMELGTKMETLVRDGCTCPLQLVPELVATHAHVLLATIVLRRDMDTYTRAGRIPQFAMREYVLDVRRVLKGSSISSISSSPGSLPHTKAKVDTEVDADADTKMVAEVVVQAFAHDDACGLWLAVGKTYILFLHDPGTRSASSVWTRGAFVADRCDRPLLWVDPDVSIPTPFARPATIQ